MSPERLADAAALRRLKVQWQAVINAREASPAQEGPPRSAQYRPVTGTTGATRPRGLERYVADDGFEALARVLESGDRREVLEILKRSGLRGRTGVGFPTGLKWQLVREAGGDARYVVCNCNDGGPGATLSTILLHNNPYAVIEGLAIAAYSVESEQGFISVPVDQGAALGRLQRAIHQCRDLGLLGPRILGSGHSFDLALYPSSGALVLRDETALISSIEGRRAAPRPRPPFPSSQGLFGQPTLICHVETLAAVPAIMLDGGDEFRSIGTRHCCGTKVFLLSGCVRHPGVVEVPMGTSLDEVVNSAGGGPTEGHAIKAIQVGGPSGGFITPNESSATADYENLHRLGASMGSGSLTVIPNDACMVDLVRLILSQISEESCGKCPPCRIGTRVLVNIVDRISRGEGVIEDLDLLEDLSGHIRSSSLCSLGQSSPNNLLSALEHFRAEFEAHISAKGCPLGVCTHRETEQ